MFWFIRFLVENTITPTCCGVDPACAHPACYPISIPATDPVYAQYGQNCLEFVRSQPAPRSGCRLGARIQLNSVTSYLDGSQIYGSKASDANRWFRQFFHTVFLLQYLLHCVFISIIGVFSLIQFKFLAVCGRRLIDFQSVDWLIDWVIEWVIELLIDCSIDWLIDWCIKFDLIKFKFSAVCSRWFLRMLVRYVVIVLQVFVMQFGFNYFLQSAGEAARAFAEQQFAHMLAAEFNHGARWRGLTGLAKRRVPICPAWMPAIFVSISIPVSSLFILYVKMSNSIWSLDWLIDWLIEWVIDGWIDR